MEGEEDDFLQLLDGQELELTALEQTDGESIDLDEFPDLELLSPSKEDWEALNDAEMQLDGKESEEEDTTDDEDELELLQKEMSYLEAQREFLRTRAKSKRHRRGTKRRENKLLTQGENELLRGLVVQQKAFTEGIQAMLELSPVNDLRMALMTPMESYIHLPKDLNERKRTILALRKEKLDMAYTFIEHKAQRLNSPYQYSDMFDKFGKHYCMNFAISTFENTTILQVARAIYKQYAELDEALNDTLGTSADRESSGSIRCNFLHQRLVSRVSKGSSIWKQMPEMESNGVFYCRFGDNSAVLATDYVDRDDLHPYNTTKRIRKDLTSGVVLTSHEADGKTFVVMKRFSLAKLHMYPHKVSLRLQNRFFQNMFDSHDAMNSLSIDRLHDTDSSGSCACAGTSKGCSCCAREGGKCGDKPEVLASCSGCCAAH